LVRCNKFYCESNKGTNNAAIGPYNKVAKTVVKIAQVAKTITSTLARLPMPHAVMFFSYKQKDIKLLSNDNLKHPVIPTL
jgi:hypothetical protein